MCNSTGYKVYGVLFLSYLLEKSLFFQKYKHQRQNFFFLYVWTYKSARFPKTNGHSHSPLLGTSPTSCALDNVNIRLLLFLLLYFGYTKNQMAIPYHGSLQPPQKHWVHEERLKVNIHSWKFIGWGSSGRTYKKHTSREKKNHLWSSSLQSSFPKAAEEWTCWMGFSIWIWFSHRLLKMEEFFPESFRLDLKDERNAFFGLCKGELS